MNFAWKPGTTSDEQWLQVDLYQVKKISAVATKGLLRNDISSYCETYTLCHSKGGAIWQAYEESDAVKVRKVGPQFVFAKSTAQRRRLK